MSVAEYLAARWFYCALALLVFAIPAPAQAQAASQGTGQLTFSLGRGSGPIGNIASDVLNQSRAAPSSALHAFGFRLGAGYQFADFVSFDVGITSVGSFRSRTTYLATDKLVADSKLTALETILVGRVPVAPNARIDLSLGAVLTSLATTLSTVSGSALPVGQQNPIDVRKIGVTFGADLEWRIGEHTSLIAGYHAYPGVGSKRVIGSASGTFSLIAGGIHFEF